MRRLARPFLSRPARLFLVDGSGALLSATFLGLIMPRYSSLFGMPPHVLYVLAGLACLFAVYSLTCHHLRPQPWAPYLRVIALANVMYGLFTLSLVGYFLEQLTALGVMYFVLELTVIVGLVAIEWMASRKREPPPG